MKRRLKYRLVATGLSVSIVLSSLMGCGNGTKSNTSAETVEESSIEVTIEESSINVEEAKKAEEEAKKAEEEAKKIAEEARKAEEEAKKAQDKVKAEEERLKAQEEAKKAEEERIRAEEEAKKAEEEAKKAEEERIKAEEAKKAEEERIKAEESKKAEERKLAEEKKRAAEEARLKEEKERNSFSMMYYLAIMAENIRISKDNRLILDDIYTSLLNDINPGAIDEITQDHLNNLRDIIKSYRNISTKRERLQFIYNQNKAVAMRNAVPNPLAILSMTHSLDWKRLAINTVYTVVASYNSYKSASENADKEFLMSGWELDDLELETIQKNRERAFNYMVDMVQEYKLDGLKTLSEKDIQNFSEICAIEYPTEKIKRLKAEEKKYALLGNYWYELANCYFDNSQYKECVKCTDKYLELSTGIYKQDSKIPQLLPKGIVAAQNVYSGDDYVKNIDSYISILMDNTNMEDWATRYFAAQVLIDLYSKTNKQKYLKDAYKIISENVTVLLKGQREINSTYLNDVKEEVAVDPENTTQYKYLTKEQQKQKDKEYSKEKERVKKYNKELKEIRKTELVSSYEPLILNCELLFALSKKTNINKAEKDEIDSILHNNVFLVRPILNAYSFNKSDESYDIEVSKKEIVIPCSLLTSGSKITIQVKDNNGTTDIDDCIVKSVKREGNSIESFKAYVSSKKYGKIKWNENSHVVVNIKYSDVYDKELTLKYKVSNYQEHWYGDKVEFCKE